MKLKLTPDASAVVDKIAQLTSLIDMQQILTVVDELYQQIKTDKHSPAKVLSQKRRELSFFYSLFVKVDHKATLDMPSRCSLLQKVFKDIQSQEALKSPEFIKLVLPYGILRLSDVETKQLVAMNQKPLSKA